MLSQSDYEFLASHAVAQYTDKEVPLNDSITKIAEVNDLNGDQIKRIVEIANTKTFLKMYKTAENKGNDIDFDVADATPILKKYYGSDKESGSMSKLASADVDSDVAPYEFEQDFDDMMRTTRHKDPGPIPQELMEKEAEAVKPKRHEIGRAHV